MDETPRGPAAAGEFADVTAFLRPRSVAVVGASDRPGNVGGAAVRFFQKFKSPCTVYPVNSRAEPVAGLAAYPTMAALPETVDLAILAIPAAAVPEAILKCSVAGIRAGIVWAGGFVEGGDEGAALQADLVAICRKRDRGGRAHWRARGRKASVGRGLSQLRRHSGGYARGVARSCASAQRR